MMYNPYWLDLEPLTVIIHAAGIIIVEKYVDERCQEFQSLTLGHYTLNPTFRLTSALPDVNVQIINDHYDTIATNQEITN